MSGLVPTTVVQNAASNFAYGPIPLKKAAVATQVDQ